MFGNVELAAKYLHSVSLSSNFPCVSGLICGTDVNLLQIVQPLIENAETPLQFAQFEHRSLNFFENSNLISFADFLLTLDRNFKLIS